MKTIIITLSLLCLMIGCSKQKPQQQEKQQSSSNTPSVDTHNPLIGYEEYSDNVYEVPEEIVKHFDTLFPNGLSDDDCFHIGEHTYQESILPAIKELERFYYAEREYYPQEQVLEALSTLQWHWEYRCSHISTEEALDSLALLFRELTTTAVRLAYDINHLATVCSKDHKLGALDFDRIGFGANPYYALMYELGDECYNIHWLPCEQEKFGEVISNIRLIAQDDIRRRYIVSCEKRNRLDPYALWVVDLYHNRTLRSYAIPNREEVSDWFDYFAPESILYFDPKELCWSYCTERNNVLHKQPNSPSLYICLTSDGFHLQAK